MSTMTPGELERSVENLRGMIAACQARSERVKARLAVAEAALSHHQHDYTRDILSKPTTFAPDTHTHSYTSSTHVHDYLDWNAGGDDHDESRTTGGPL